MTEQNYALTSQKCDIPKEPIYCHDEYYVSELHLCTLCNKEFSKDIRYCSLVHCEFCGNTNLRTMPSRISTDPVFVLIHTLFALMLVYLYFNVESGPFGASFALIGVMLYLIVLSAFLMSRNKSSKHYCKDCSTVARIINDVVVAEYETVPEKKKVIQKKEPKLRHLKEIIMIFGSVGSVASLVLILAPK